MKNTLFNERLVTIFLICISLYGLLLCNLARIQIVKHGFFTQLAQQQYQISVTVKPPRAEMFDRSGHPLALNKDTLSAFIIPTRLEQSKELGKFLKKHFPQAFERLSQAKKSHFMYIKRRLNDEQIELINQSGLTDIKFLKEPNRYYPNQTLGPILGITNIDNQGTIGLELQLNAELSGQPSTHLLCKDARSGHFYFDRQTTIVGSEGSPVELTIDSTLQFLVHQELIDWVKQINAKEGAALIMDPESGDLIALAQYPDFNPENTEGLDVATTKNRIALDAYELGSVIKIFLALAALQEGVVTPDELIDCENRTHTSLNGFSFSTVKPHGTIPFWQVIQDSNNIGVAKVALRLKEKLYEHYKKMGFGCKPGVFQAESAGFITPPHHWSKASIITLSFGYEISATLLHLAQATGIIATDGYLVRPRIRKDIPIHRSGPLYSEMALNAIKDMMLKTISQGTAKRARIEGYTIMGKTGTARLITNGTYDHTRNIFSFAGIIQKDHYKRVIITFIKETTQKNAYAASIAAPIFERIAQKMLIHDRVL